MGSVVRSSVWPKGLRATAIVAASSLPALLWAAGQNDPLEFDLPAAPLGDTLLLIARTSGTLVSFNPSLVNPYMAPPIRGHFTWIEAITLATKDSGLALEVTPGGAATLLARAAPPAPAPAASPTPVPLIETPPQVVLPPVEVVGKGRDANGLAALRSNSASRTDTPLAELPQAVSVLTAAALAVQGDSTSLEAMRFVTGVTLSVDPIAREGGLSLPGIEVRGLPALYALSGMRTMRGVLPAETPFIERIEITKGPSTTIGGISETGGRGGVVNVVRKQAGPEVSREVMQSVSTQDGGTLRLGADMGGTLSSGPNFWRLTGYGSQTGRTEGGYTQQFGSGLLGSLTHRSADLRATLTMQIDRRRTAPAPSGVGGGLPRADGSFAPVQEGILPPRDPTDRILASTADVEIDVEQRLFSTWRGSLKARVEAIEADLRRHQLRTVDLVRRNQGWAVGMQWGLTGDISTGPVQHKLLLALDLERWRLFEEGVNIDGFDPRGVVDMTTQELKQALLIQDQLQLGPLRLRLAVQRARTPLFSNVQGGFNFTAQPILATGWDAGALILLSPGVSIYGGSQFSIETDRRRPGFTLEDGAAAPLGKLRQAQVGGKFQWWDERLVSTIEAFRLRHRDLVYNASLVLPGRSVDGIEFELAGRLRPGLEMRTGLTLSQGNEVIPLPNLTGGQTIALTGVPTRNVYALVRYQLPQEWVSRTRLGLSLNAESFRVASVNPRKPESQLTVPGGARLDMTLEHLMGSWTINLSARNALDRQLYGARADPRFVPLLPGRSVNLTATYRD